MKKLIDRILEKELTWYEKLFAAAFVAFCIAVTTVAFVVGDIWVFSWSVESRGVVIAFAVLLTISYGLSESLNE